MTCINALNPRAQNSLSIVIPFYNEAGNAALLIEEIHQALAELNIPWEIIAINDGSTDSTETELYNARTLHGEHITVISFMRNFGQTAAMQAGIETALGSLIVTLDGDRQNDPADIPRMLNYLLDNDLDMVAGWRKQRQDPALYRKLPSKIANYLIRKVTGVKIKDNGCSLKVYRSHVIKQVVLMGEMHRFIAAWVASVTDPTRIGEMAVNHRARCIGQSKYGLSRTSRVILDLFSVLFFMRFAQRPGHFFGSIGLTLGSIGGLMLTYLLGLKLFFAADIGNRPLFFTGILCVITGIQLVTTGILAEVQTRTKPVKNYPIKVEAQPQIRSWHAKSAA